MLKLRRELPGDWGIKAEVEGLHELSQWATHGRYPDTMRSPTREDALAALQAAKKVLQML